MLRLKHPRLIPHVLIPILVTFVIGLPVLCQPLGLFYAWNNPDAASQASSNTTETLVIDSGSDIVDPASSLEYVDEAFNRSLSENISELIEENQVDINETKPDVLDDEEEPDETQTTDIPDESLPIFWDTAPEPTDPPSRIVDYILYISANELNLRAEPSTDSEILAELKFGEKVECKIENDDWMQVTYKGITGYVKTEYTSRSMVFKQVSETVYVAANKLNLRRAPSTSADIIITMGYMQRLTRTGTGDGWSRVRTPAGRTGYVASEFLTTHGYSTSGKVIGGATYSSAVDKVVALAYRALGVRYVHGGSSMSGFDCSGFVSWVYRQIGVTIPRSTSGYYTIGKSVSYANLRPGDIICMDTRSRDGIKSITHVAIYVGKGMMIHASSSHHKVVLQNVQQYLNWGVKIITIRRILN
jgi:cell wall-associated NlpC family hydrolase